MKSALILIAALALGGCASPTPGTSIDGHWTLVSATDATGSLPLDLEHPITLEVGENSGGVAACNHYTSTYADGQFGEISQTEMGCFPASVMELEARYLAALAAVTGATADTQLVLTGPEIELQFEVTPTENSLPLVGTIWKLVSVTESSDPDGTTASPLNDPTVTFTDDTFAFQTGCNSISGSYSLDGNVITPGSDVGTTLMACEDAGLMAQDAALTTLVSLTFTVAQPTTLNSAQLMLTGAAGAVAKFTAG